MLIKQLAKVILTAITFAGMVLPGFADINPEDNLQNWSIVTLNAKLKNRVLAYLEIQPRTTLTGPEEDNENRFNILLVRPAIGYQVTKSLSVWQGYGWTPSFNPEFRNEHRLWQQVLLNNKIKSLTLVNRTRLEERFIEDAGETSVRGRHMIRLAMPVDKQEKWSLVSYDEAFLNFNSTPNGPKSGFDQNRIFIGLNRKINKHISLEGGYINQYINRKSPTRDRLNHGILVWLNINI